MNAESVLKILETETVVYRRPLASAFHVFLCPTSLQLLYTRPEGGIEEKAVLWRKSERNVAALRGVAENDIFETLPGGFANFLSNWEQLYRERRWARSAPSLNEIARVINAYCSATGYDLLILSPGQPLHTATPYAPVEPEEMHVLTGWDS